MHTYILSTVEYNASKGKSNLLTVISIPHGAVILQGMSVNSHVLFNNNSYENIYHN